MAKIKVILVLLGLCFWSTSCGTGNSAVSANKIIGDQSPQSLQELRFLKMPAITCEDPGVIWHTLREVPKSPYNLLELVDKTEPAVNFKRTDLPEKKNVGYRYGNCRDGAGGFLLLVHDLAYIKELPKERFLPPRNAGHCYRAWVYLTGEFKDFKLIKGSWTHLLDPKPSENKYGRYYEDCAPPIEDSQEYGYYLEGRWDHSAASNRSVRFNAIVEDVPFTGDLVYWGALNEGNSLVYTEKLKSFPVTFPTALEPGITTPDVPDRRHFDGQKDSRRYLSDRHFENLRHKVGRNFFFFSKEGESPLKQRWISAAKKRAEYMKLQRENKIAAEEADAERAKAKAYQDEIDANRTTNDLCKMFRETYNSGRECGLACIRDHGNGSAACLRNCDKCFN